MGQGAPGWLELADRVVVQLGLALVLGGAASSRWLREAGSPWSTLCLTWSSGVARAGSALGMMAAVAAVWLQAADMADVPLARAGATVVTLLRDTHYGHAALIGMAAWSVVVAMAWRGSSGLALLIATLVVAWSRSVVSHAGNSGDASFDVAIDVVHLLATSLWVGIVLVALRLPRPASAGADRLDASRWLASLSSFATAALVAVVLTGSFKVWRAVPDWRLLPASDYGHVLFIKLALVAAAVLLGGYNRLRVLPGLLAALGRSGRSGADAPWLARWLGVLRIEGMVLFLVLGGAAALSTTEPPG